MTEYSIVIVICYSHRGTLRSSFPG